MLLNLSRRAAQPPEENFWRWVQDHLPERNELRHRGPDFVRQARDRVSGYCAHLVVEISEGKDELPEIVISAEGIREFFPKVQELVTKAPRSESFRVVAFRQPIPVPKDFAVSYRGGEELSVNDVWFTLHKIEGEFCLDIYVRGATGRNGEHVKAACFVIMDRLLGEYTVATRIGPIEWFDLPADPVGMKLRPILEINQAFNEFRLRR